MMRVNLLVLLLALSACQPETPAKQDAPAKQDVPVVNSAPQAVVAVVADNDPLAIAKKSDCLTCHAIDKKVVGPAWKDVAVKYRGDATAEERLVNKIAKGGSGSWGAIPMPAHPQLNEADRRILAKFVLNLN